MFEKYIRGELEKNARAQDKSLIPIKHKIVLNDDKMTQILRDYSKPEIITSIHGSWNLCMQTLCSKHPQADYRTTAHYILLNSGIKISMLNRVMKTNMIPEEADEKILEVKQHFESKGLPFTWQVDSGDNPIDLAERLEKAGFVRDETPGMAAKIGELIEPRILEGFRCERVQTSQQLTDYAKLLVKAYGMPEFGWDFLINGWTRLGVVPDFQHYIGYLNDVPVATSMVLYGEGVAGLFNVATLPEARGKGVGALISYAPFIDAGKRGYKVGILHASSMGYPVYKRLGFEEVCKLVRYQWNPS